MVSNKKLSFNDDEDDDDSGTEEQRAQPYRKPAIGPGAGHSESKSDDIELSAEVKTISDIPKEETDHSNKAPELDEKERRLKEIREQIQVIKQQIEQQTELTSSKEKETSEDCDNTDNNGHQETVVTVGFTNNLGRSRVRIRERETVELVTDFRKRMKAASGSVKIPLHPRTPSDDDIEANPDLLVLADSDDWLTHKFDAKDDPARRLAKDANTKDDTWYSIDDPRNSMNRREAESSRSSSRRDYHSSSNNRSQSDSRHRERHRH